MKKIIFTSLVILAFTASCKKDFKKENRKLRGIKIGYFLIDRRYFVSAAP